mmetsp:Transcript_18074/g.59041  ORF Transcript_18074/g.59041 Transcript_18074/m.59041 type:complete len:282 (-) Transcript_18074:2459-3304(-)
MRARFARTLFRHARLDVGSPEVPETLAPVICIPGGGIYAFWQIGALTRVAETHDLRRVHIAGASSGALAAVLGACGATIDFPEKVRQVAERHGLRERGLGGVWGVWGSQLMETMDGLLPEDAHERCGSRCHIHLMGLTRSGFERTTVSRFESRKDVMRAACASMHLPWIMDGCITSSFRGGTYLDGGYLLSNEAFISYHTDAQRKVLLVDHNLDPLIRKARFALDTVHVPSIEDAVALFERGYEFVDEAPYTQEALAGVERSWRAAPAAPLALRVGTLARS